MEIDADDIIEEFYVAGIEDELVAPDHFQGLFLLMGILISTGLGKLSYKQGRKEANSCERKV